jgi:hypothetical protein
MLPVPAWGIKNRELLRRAELIRVAQYAFMIFLGDLAGPP